MNVSLTKHQKDYIKSKLRTGQYADSSEIVREALRLLETIETERDRIEMALDEANREPAVPIGKTFWKDLRADLHKGHRRAA